MKVRLSEFEDNWKLMFQNEARLLMDIFGDEIIDIEHFGSTAVKDMKAKPVVDMMVIVREIEKIDAFNDQMETLGYDVAVEWGIKGRRLFRKGGDERTHHIHFYQYDNPEIERHLVVRDYLRTHPEEVAEYSRLKEELANLYDHTSEYSSAKKEYVSKLEERALNWHHKDTILFQNGELEVRKLDQKDVRFMAKWLSDNRVLEFYEGRDQPFDAEKVREDFLNEESDVVSCMVLFKGKEVGYIQFYQVEKEYKKKYSYTAGEIYGIDQFIGEPTYWNKGIGTLLVSSMVNFLLTKKGADVVVMDPQVRNSRAIRCYEKCGFKKVKMLPEHELHESVYQDCWLMEYRN